MFQIGEQKLAFTTDSYVINPVFDFTINRVDNFSEVQAPVAEKAVYNSDVDAVVGTV